MCAARRFGIGGERLPECVARCRQVAPVERQIRRSEVERNVVLFGKFLELFLGGLNVFFASRRFSQSDNGVAIVRGLLEDFERFFSCVGKVPDGHITTGEPYSILNVLRVQLARLCQKRSGAQGCSVVLPHCSDSFECERVLRIQLEHVEVAQLGFVVVARFEIIVGLGKKARSSWLPWSRR